MTVKKHFQPGESVPETAVYGVVHDGHRAIHHATLRKGERFPQCNKCKDRVRFEILHRASVGPSTSATKPAGRQKAVPEYVVLVDNGCTDGGVDQVATMPAVSVERPGENTGFAGGCNVGAERATGTYLALMRRG